MDGQNFNPFTSRIDLGGIPSSQRLKLGELEMPLSLPKEANGYTGVNIHFERKKDGSLWYVEDFEYQEKESAAMPIPFSTPSDQFSSITPNLLLQNKIKPNIPKSDEGIKFIVKNVAPRVLYSRELPLDVYENKLRRLKHNEIVGNRQKEQEAKDQELFELVIGILQMVPGEGWALKFIRGTALALGTANDVGKYIESDNKLKFIAHYATEKALDHFVEKGTTAVMLLDNADNLGGKKKIFFDLTNYAQTKVIQSRILPDEPMFYKSEADRLLVRVHQFRYEVDPVYRRNADNFATLLTRIKASQQQIPGLQSTRSFSSGINTDTVKPHNEPMHNSLQKTKHASHHPHSIKLDKPFLK
jgi:hypothetical protein